MAEYGDRMMAFKMQPLGAEGRPISARLSCASVDNVEDARTWARAHLETAPFTTAVEITGRERELAPIGWTLVVDGESYRETVRRHRAKVILPKPGTAATGHVEIFDLDTLIGTWPGWDGRVEALPAWFGGFHLAVVSNGPSPEGPDAGITYQLRPF